MKGGNMVTVGHHFANAVADSFFGGFEVPDDFVA